MFKIELNNIKKVLTITVGGFFKEEEGKAFLQEYQKSVGSIKPADYSLVVDGTELLISKQEMVPILENCMMLYKRTGFKKSFGVYPKSPSSAMQLRKVAEKIQLPMEFGSTVGEVLRKI